VLKGRQISWPRIASGERIMTVGSARPMEDAARIAYAELAGWLVGDYASIETAYLGSRANT